MVSNCPSTHRVDTNRVDTDRVDTNKVIGPGVNQNARTCWCQSTSLTPEQDSAALCYDLHIDGFIQVSGMNRHIATLCDSRLANLHHDDPGSTFVLATSTLGWTCLLSKPVICCLQVCNLPPVHTRCPRLPALYLRVCIAAYREPRNSRALDGGLLSRRVQGVHHHLLAAKWAALNPIPSRGDAVPRGTDHLGYLRVTKGMQGSPLIRCLRVADTCLYGFNKTPAHSTLCCAGKTMPSCSLDATVTHCQPSVHCCQSGVGRSHNSLSVLGATALQQPC